MPTEPEDCQAYQEILSRWGPLEQDDVFRLLGAVQDACGHVPRPVLEDVSRRLRRPLAELYGAATAYPGLRTAPPEGER